MNKEYKAYYTSHPTPEELVEVGLVCVGVLFTIFVTAAIFSGLGGI